MVHQPMPSPEKCWPTSDAPSATVSFATGCRRIWRPATLPQLAAEPSVTQHSIRPFLRSPHETMPHITFTPDQMDDIVDHRLSLKIRH
jgi:hypothetical protein